MTMLKSSPKCLTISQVLDRHKNKQFNNIYFKATVVSVGEEETIKVFKSKFQQGCIIKVKDDTKSIILVVPPERALTLRVNDFIDVRNAYLSHSGSVIISKWSKIEVITKEMVASVENSLSTGPSVSKRVLKSPKSRISRPSIKALAKSTKKTTSRTPRSSPIQKLSKKLTNPKLAKPSDENAKSSSADVEITLDSIDKESPQVNEKSPEKETYQNVDKPIQPSQAPAAKNEKKKRRKARANQAPGSPPSNEASVSNHSSSSSPAKDKGPGQKKGKNSAKNSSPNSPKSKSTNSPNSSKSQSTNPPKSKSTNSPDSPKSKSSSAVNSPKSKSTNSPNSPKSKSSNSPRSPKSPNTRSQKENKVDPGVSKATPIKATTLLERTVDHKQILELKTNLLALLDSPVFLVADKLQHKQARRGRKA